MRGDPCQGVSPVLARPSVWSRMKSGPSRSTPMLVDAVVLGQRTQVGLALEEGLDVLRRSGERPAVPVLGEDLVRLPPDDRDLLGVEHLSKHDKAEGVEMRNLRLRQHDVPPRFVYGSGVRRRTTSACRSRP